MPGYNQIGVANAAPPVPVASTPGPRLAVYAASTPHPVYPVYIAYSDYDYG